MLKKYKHIAFDLDGTLVHTIPEYRHKIVPEVVNQLGGTIDDIRSIDKFWFEAERSATIQNEFHINPDKFWKLFRAMDSIENRSANTQAYEDVEKIFYKLKASSKTVSIITGAPHYIAQMEIEKLNGAPHDFYLSIFDNKFAEKPDPESLFYVLKKLNMNPHETVYIGNSNEDAYYAKNSGVDFIYLERKKHDFDLKDCSVAVIHSLDELF